MEIIHLVCCQLTHTITHELFCVKISEKGSVNPLRDTYDASKLDHVNFISTGSFEIFISHRWDSL